MRKRIISSSKNQNKKKTKKLVVCVLETSYNINFWSTIRFYRYYNKTLHENDSRIRKK